LLNEETGYPAQTWRTFAKSDKLFYASGKQGYPKAFISNPLDREEMHPISFTRSVKYWQNFNEEKSTTRSAYRVLHSDSQNGTLRIQEDSQAHR
jgi:hypothetical protein